MSKYFSSQYWFGNPVPPALGHADKLAFVIGLVLAAIGFALMYYRTTIKDRAKKNLIAKKYNLLITIGLLAMVWFGFRFELIKIFGTRIVVAIIYVVGLIWAYYVWRYYKRVYLHDKYLAEQEQIKNRYR